MGGSGGGLGNGGEAGGCRRGCNRVCCIRESHHQSRGENINECGGTVFVNPSIGANFGGAGSGGAVRIVADEIENLGFIEVKGGDAPGSDVREPGSTYLRDAGGAGGGGRVRPYWQMEI